MRRSGDGFVTGADGHMRWGRYGAAGIVFVTGTGAERVVLLQLRSAFAHEGGTWSIPGGALDEGETPIEGGLREASEEVGDLPEHHRILGEHRFAPDPEWNYTTIVVEVDALFGEAANFESDAVEWVALDAVDDRALHPGFAAAWPHLRTIAGGG